MDATENAAVTESAAVIENDTHNGEDVVTQTSSTALKYTDDDVAIYKDSIRKANARVGELELKNDRLATSLEAEKKKNHELSEALEGYEKAMMEITAKSSASVSVAEFVALEKANEQGVEDLESVEQSFAELHERYERLRTVASNLKQNEEALITALNHGKERIRQQEEEFGVLKAHAEKTVNDANLRISEVRAESEENSAVSQLALKKANADLEHEIERSSIEKTALEEKLMAEMRELEQMNALLKKEKLELHDICDQLMAIRSSE